MEWLNVLPWAGWAACLVALAGLCKERWARQTEHEKVVVTGKQLDVEVAVKQDQAETDRFDVGMKNYHELVESLHAEMDRRELQYQRDLLGLRERLTTLEAEHLRCNEKVVALQRDVERIQAENYQLRQRLGG